MWFSVKGREIDHWLAETEDYNYITHNGLEAQYPVVHGGLSANYGFSKVDCSLLQTAVEHYSTRRWVNE